MLFQLCHFFSVSHLHETKHNEKPSGSIEPVGFLFALIVQLNPLYKHYSSGQHPVICDPDR